jgi:hypothetical protein
MSEHPKTTSPINWQPIIELAIAAAMVIGTVVPLYVHTDGKLHDALSSIQSDMKDFQDEMKHIHGRLEKNDAEFKAFLMNKNKKEG